LLSDVIGGITFLPLLVVFMFGVYIEAKIYRGPVIAFYLALLVVFVIPQCIISFRGEQNETVIYLFSLWGALFLLCFSSLRCLLYFYVIRNLRLKGSSDDHSVAFILYLLLLLGFIFLLAAVDFNLTKATRLEWSDLRSESPVLITLASYFFIFSSSLLVVLFQRRSWLMLILVVFSILAAVSLLKSRAVLVSYFAALIVYLYYRFDKGVGARTAIFIGALSCGFFYVSARAVRHVGSVEDVFQNPALFIQAIMAADYGEFELIKAAYYIYEAENVSGELYSDALLRRILFFYVPSELNWLKPRDFSHAIWDSYTGIMGVGGSYHVGAILDSYLNNKQIGFLVYPLLYVFVFFLLDCLRQCSSYYRALMYGPLITACFYVGRGAIYNGLMILVAAVLVFTLIALILRLASGTSSRMRRLFSYHDSGSTG
jgi:hypothetical protein